MSVSEIQQLFLSLSDAYRQDGDEGRAASFSRASDAIACLKVIKSGADIANLQGIGKSSVEIVDEYLTTGRCERLDDMLDFLDIIEKCKRVREDELSKMKKPTSKEVTKAFVLTNHPYVGQRAKEVKDVIKTMDVHLRVLVAHALKRDGYLPREVGDDTLCEDCHLILDESCRDECTCARVREYAEAEAIGCKNLPDFN
jgi:DNA polymerase/3'-5' exonuclease PolX